MATDTNAVIGIEANKSVPGVETNTQDELELDLDQDADGLNTNANFTFGIDKEAPAFTISNNANGVIDSLKIGYLNAAQDDGANVTLHIDTSDGVQTVTEEDPLTEVETDWDSEDLEVWITVDTTGRTSADGLSGTLTIEASDHS
jgi:hypothetical protein